MPTTGSSACGSHLDRGLEARGGRRGHSRSGQGDACSGENVAHRCHEDSGSVVAGHAGTGHQECSRQFAELRIEASCVDAARYPDQRAWAILTGRACTGMLPKYGM